MIRKLSRAWARGVLALLAAIVGLRYVVRGADNRPPQPCLIVVNHQSTWETLAALVLFPDVAIVAKRQLLRIPVMGWYLKHSPMIIIDREQGTKALRQMTHASRVALAEGRSVLIFPQGTRTPVGIPVRFKRGVELLYRSLAIPVLPVALDAGRFWGPGAWAKAPGTVTVSMLTPIEPGMSAAQFVRMAEAAIEAETAVMAIGSSIES
ncbi:1-acyl-sn-glycerol-3-phosphate acyltransferase [Phenylobacterium soli]|uniref:1-acyl-sn-glycerol-3-phosphate acyltransferase n=2 Tax=Phenylobacterium soli TaxID=2170551 RepID=A0A328AR83_9CAUL|nr:1-acyl-sn-glycerol-3-phosphate acyltransferase [Phenylobacterium soli]